jgi:hypothetical protein
MLFLSLLARMMSQSAGPCKGRARKSVLQGEQLIGCGLTAVVSSAEMGA